MEHSAKVGEHVVNRFKALREKHEIIGDVRGVGLFVGVELVSDRKTKVPATAEAQHVIYRLKEKHILFSADGPDRNVLKLKPPMTFSMTDADDLVDAIDEILTEISQADMVFSMDKAAELMHGSANAPEAKDASYLKRSQAANGSSSNGVNQEPATKKSKR